MRRLVVLMMLMMLICSICAVAQVNPAVARNMQKRLLGIEIHFRLDKHELDKEYMGNDRSLDRFAYLLDSIGREYVDSVVIVSQSSPEGAYSYNQKLSERRAKTMRAYVESNSPELKDRLFVYPDGESWNQLREYVCEDSLLTDEAKAKVLEIIDADLDMTAKKRQMQQLPAYRYLLRTYYPRIRNSMIGIVYYTEKPVEPLSPEPMSLAVRRSMDVPVLAYPAVKPSAWPESEKRTILAVKTNLLYDVLTALNFSVEVPIGDKFSALYYHQFPWWTWGEANNEYCMRFLSIGAEGRWWFKPMPREATAKRIQRDRLMGHFVGLYAESGKYDFQRKRDICYQGEFWSTGLSYGYAMPLGKRLNLEFSLSVGYASIAYRGYTPSEDYEILWRDPDKVGRWHYFGPTKAQVSLVLPFLVKMKKGGAK